MGRHYLYRHIRLDTEEPFYVGIGTKPKRNYCSHTAEYSRAYAKTGTERTNFWKGIISKSDYEVEILMESDDYEFIKQKEIEFIALHGRRNLGKGTLCNLTDGGDGVLGSIKTKEEREAISKRQLGELNHMYGRRGKDSPIFGLIRTEENRKNISIAGLLSEDSRSKLILDMATGVFYKNVREAAEALCINRNTLSGYLNGKRINKTSLIRV